MRADVGIGPYEGGDNSAINYNLDRKKSGVDFHAALVYGFRYRPAPAERGPWLPSPEP